MGKRIVAWLLAAVVAGGLVAGGVVLAGARANKPPHPLPPLDVGGVPATAQRSATAALPTLPGGATPANKGATVQVVGNLPELPGKARAYVLRPATADRVAALAAALGLHGSPQPTDAGWALRDGNRILNVSRFAGSQWSYFGGVVASCGGPAPGLATPRCAVNGGVPQAGAGVGGAPAAGASAGAAGSGTAVAGARVTAGATASVVVATPSSVTAKPCIIVPTGGEAPLDLACKEPGPVRLPPDVPSRQAAEQAARTLLERAGVDLGGASSSVNAGFGGWSVTFEPAAGGLPTARLASTVVIGGRGRVVSGSGSLARVQPGEVYPLIGVQEALKRLPPLAFGTREALPPGTPINCIREPCPVPAPLPASRPPKVTGVRLGLEFAGVYGDVRADTAYLVPVYLFQLDSGVTVPVVAVQDRYLSKPPQPKPQPAPVPPSGGGSGGSPTPNGG